MKNYILFLLITCPVYAMENNSSTSKIETLKQFLSQRSEGYFPCVSEDYRTKDLHNLKNQLSLTDTASIEKLLEESDCPDQNNKIWAHIVSTLSDETMRTQWLRRLWRSWGIATGVAAVVAWYMIMHKLCSLSGVSCGGAQ